MTVHSVTQAVTTRASVVDRQPCPDGTASYPVGEESTNVVDVERERRPARELQGAAVDRDAADLADEVKPVAMIAHLEVDLHPPLSKDSRRLAWVSAVPVRTRSNGATWLSVRQRPPNRR